MTNLEPQCLETDVLVAGGGMAGLATAITAAYAGARVVLLERSHVLGGNASLANVHTFCGLFEPPRDGNFVYANPGFASWFSEGLRCVGGALPPQVHGRVGVLPIYPSRLAEYAQAVTAKFPTLNLRLDSNLIGLDMDSSGSTPALATFEQQNATHHCRAQIVIDTTGDATASALIGADVSIPIGRDLQNATLIFRVLGANRKSLEGYARLKLSAAITRGTTTGLLPEECESVLVRPGEQQSEAYVSLNLPKPTTHAYDPLDGDFMQTYTERSHHFAKILIAFLRDNIAGWEDCRLLEFPQQIGVRESRHVIGKTIMTEADILIGKQFEDTVARSVWPIELWHDHKGAEFQYPEETAGIPLSALVSRSHDNLGMAGRCMSGTPSALGALRVLGTAMATGQAIGMAAAVAVNEKVSLSAVQYADVNERLADLTKRDFIES